MHGFTTGEVVPATELLVAHQDVGDRPGTVERAEALLAGGEPFCWRRR